jgi:NADPH:quinone reductase
MKAVRVPRYGGVEVLEYIDMDQPRPQEGEVLLRVHAAGINYADVLMRFGMYPGGLKPPFIAGMEVAGEIVEAGKGVDPGLTGKRVMGMAPSGGYAEYVTALARATLALPAHFSYEQGAAFPVTYQTAYHALITCGRARAGQTVLIHAAAGGVGTAAVQISKLLGLCIIATASSDEKLEKVRAMGADICVNYAEKDFVPVVLEATHGRGCELILESVGGAVFRNSFKCLAVLGKMIVYGIASGELEIVHPRELLFKNQSVIGLHLTAVAQNPELSIPAIKDLSTWVAERRLSPAVGHRFPLVQVAEAHRLMESRQSYGKIVLLP